MQVTITGKNIDITDALRSHTEEKMTKITQHFDSVIDTNIVLNVEKARHIAEATVHAAGATINASAESDDMYVAIDMMATKLDRQVVKHKEKLQQHR